MTAWQHDGRGPFASSGAEVGGFCSLGDAGDVPNVQFGALPMPAPNHDMILPQRRGMAMLVGVIDVASCGAITLRSADPLDAPYIDPGYFGDPADLDVLVAGVRQAREIAAHTPLADRACRPRRSDLHNPPASGRLAVDLELEAELLGVKVFRPIDVCTSSSLKSTSYPRCRVGPPPRGAKPRRQLRAAPCQRRHSGRVR
jgi:choline dehydrogenase-like flavoprotein